MAIAMFFMVFCINGKLIFNCSTLIKHKFNWHKSKAQISPPWICLWCAFLWVDICDRLIALIKDHGKLSLVKKLF